MAAIRAAPKDRMNWMTSCTFALTRAHFHWARFARFMVTVWLRSGPLVRLQAVALMILVPKCCLFATIAGPIRLLGTSTVRGNIESPPMAVGASVNSNDQQKQLNNANAGSRSRCGSS
jgi:hypothetical protein